MARHSVRVEEFGVHCISVSDRVSRRRSAAETHCRELSIHSHQEPRPVERLGAISPETYGASLARRGRGHRPAGSPLRRVSSAVREARVASPGAYTLCQTQAPPNRYLASPPCRTVNIAAGTSVFAGWFTNNEQQVPSQ